MCMACDPYASKCRANYNSGLQSEIIVIAHSIIAVSLICERESNMQPIYQCELRVCLECTFRDYICIYILVSIHTFWKRFAYRGSHLYLYFGCNAHILEEIYI